MTTEIAWQKHAMFPQKNTSCTQPANNLGFYNKKLFCTSILRKYIYSHKEMINAIKHKVI
jgi:hypothetical protein